MADVTKGKPILFSAPMVRALLAGTKTQTRRVLPSAHPKFPKYNLLNPDLLVDKREVWFWDGVHERVGASYLLRYAPGDRLWVREQHSFPQGWMDQPDAVQIGQVFYPATADAAFPSSYLRERPQDHTRLRPSIHMPRWASRLTLTVTEVRVQRLQEISEADAVAEGINPCAEGARCPEGAHGACCGQYDPVGEYRDLWNSIHGQYAWHGNPWVRATTFTVAHRNIDQVHP